MKARFRALWRPLLAALLLLVAVAPGVGARPRSLQDLAAITGKLVATGIKYGEIPSLYRPRYDRVSDADLSLSGDDVVFVVQLPDGPRTGIFCRLGLLEERRPVAVAFWLKVVWMRPWASTRRGKGSR